jgi:curved DNA-binding protein CbpA
VAVERDAYVVLQVLPEAPQDVIQAAYRALARRYHPDGREPRVELMKEINLAYERVGSVEKRALYDAERRRQPVAVGPGRQDAQRQDPAGLRQDMTGSPASDRRVGAASARTPRAADELDFGRYAGWRIAQIARHDPEYLRWLSRHSAGIRYLEAIRRCLPGEEDLGRRTGRVGAGW